MVIRGQKWLITLYETGFKNLSMLQLKIRAGMWPVKWKSHRFDPKTAKTPVKLTLSLGCCQTINIWVTYFINNSDYRGLNTHLCVFYVLFIVYLLIYLRENSEMNEGFITPSAQSSGLTQLSVPSSHPNTMVLLCNHLYERKLLKFQCQSASLYCRTFLFKGISAETFFFLL